MSLGQKLRYGMQGLITRNAYVKYEQHMNISSSSNLKVKSKVKVFQKLVRL